jgi:membrane protein
MRCGGGRVHYTRFESNPSQRGLTMSNVRTVLGRITDLLKNRIWRYDRKTLPRGAAWLLHAVQIIAGAIRGYVRDNCALHASALTFYSLLSVVPIAALAFGIAKGFGLEQRLEKQLFLRFAGQEEVLTKIIGFARNLLDNTQGGLIAGIGVAVLFWTSVKVLSHMEGSLNIIWSVRGRPFIRKFTNYLSLLIISPLLVIVSSSLTVFIKTQVLAATERWGMLQAAWPVITLSLKLLPFGLIWLLFILIYLVIPNTRVRFRSALIAGVLAGSLFQMSQGIYISAQVVVARYNAIYGSFAALPLFLIWLQISWMVVLLGAQIAHAHQHVGRQPTDDDFRNSPPEFTKRCALYILHWVIQRFSEGAAPPTTEQIARHLMLPDATVDTWIGHLRRCGLVSAVSLETTDDPAYQPAKDIHTICVASVLEALDTVGRMPPPCPLQPAFDAVTRAVEAIRQETHRLPGNILVKDI